jgi:hypothetical protein
MPPRSPDYATCLKEYCEIVQEAVDYKKQEAADYEKTCADHTRYYRNRGFFKGSI